VLAGDLALGFGDDRTPCVVVEVEQVAQRGPPLRLRELVVLPVPARPCAGTDDMLGHVGSAQPGRLAAFGEVAGEVGVAGDAGALVDRLAHVERLGEP